MLRASKRLLALTSMTGSRPLKPLLVVVGATGTGKSQLAVDLASRFNGEVINGDAMQMYEGLPIVTNKIRIHERKGIPHHLLGCISLEEQPWTVLNFVNNALESINDLHKRGKLPIIVGGTHYYLQSLLFNESLADKASVAEPNGIPASHKQQQWPILDAPTEELLAELKRVDPVMASRWHPNDHRKIKRSLEIFLTTGKRASEIYEDQQRALEPIHGNEDGGSDFVTTRRAFRYPTLLLWTHTERELLVKRLDNRVDAMLQEGLLEEVTALEQARHKLEAQVGVIDDSRGIWTAIGYKEFREYYKRLKSTRGGNPQLVEQLNCAIEQTKVATRQYSKSQIRWIRNKLNNAVQGAAPTSMFLMSTSNPIDWETQMLEPAFELTRNFLDGVELPNPLDQSDIGRQMLTPKRGYDMGQRRDLWKNRKCEICNITAVTEDQWQQHIQSRRHRNTLRAKEKNHVSATSLKRP